VTSEKIVYDNPWITLTEYQTIAPTGRPALYGKVAFKNRAIGVVPLHADGTVTLVGQNRFAHANYSWEIPEGGAPLDEDPLDGAKRELAEEVGLEAADWRLILTMELSNSITDEFCHGYPGPGPDAHGDRAGRDRGPGDGPRAVWRGPRRGGVGPHAGLLDGGFTAPGAPYGGEGRTAGRSGAACARLATFLSARTIHALAVEKGGWSISKKDAL
jgi:8-oxo-dGTP pyrophosphatase MutT (NUDIX family)